MPVIFKTAKVAQRAQSDPLLYEMLRDIGATFKNLGIWVLDLFAERVSGTPGFIPKWETDLILGDSPIYTTGTLTGINTTNPGFTLDVQRDDGLGAGTHTIFTARKTNGTATEIGGVALGYYVTGAAVTHGFVRGTSAGTGLYLGTVNTPLAVTIAPVTGDVGLIGGVYGFRSKTLTEGAATSFADISIAAGEYVAGECLWAAYATDATDSQMRTGRLRFVAVNKAGTITVSVNEVGTPEVALSAGTLTVSNTVTTGASKITLQSNATSSLVQTTLALRYRIDLLTTAAVITPL